MKKIFHSVRFMIKLQYIKKTKLCFLNCFVSFHAPLHEDKENSSIALKWFHRFVHTSLDSIVNLSLNWSINNLFVGKLTLGRYDVAVL